MFYRNVLAPSRQASDAAPRHALLPWHWNLTATLLMVSSCPVAYLPGFLSVLPPHPLSKHIHTLLLLMQSSICSLIFARPSFTGSISGFIKDFFWKLGVTGRARLGGFQSGSKQQNLAFGWKQKNMSNHVSQEGWKVWTKTCQVSKLRPQYYYQTKLNPRLCEAVRPYGCTGYWQRLHTLCSWVQTSVMWELSGRQHQSDQRLTPNRRQGLTASLHVAHLWLSTIEKGTAHKVLEDLNVYLIRLTL